jgi:multicomponent Na+:H+ antiporter subunit D
MVSKTNAFFVAGWVYRKKGTLDLKVLGDVFKETPIWGVLFFISAFSLAGLPLLSGFIGKYLILKAGIEANHIFITLVALIVGLFTLFSMVKIWLEVFWKNSPEEKIVSSDFKPLPDHWMLVSSLAMALAIIGLGIWSQPVVSFCELAAADLLNPSKYIQYVIGKN